MVSLDGSCFRSRPNTKTPRVALADSDAVTDTTRTPASSGRRHLKSPLSDESGLKFPIRRSAADYRRRFRAQRGERGSTPMWVLYAVTGRVHTCGAWIGGDRGFPAPVQRQVRRSRRAVADMESDCR